MPRLSLWQSGIKGNDFRFFDRTISEMFGVGGTAVFVHKYLGPYQQTDPDDPNNPLPHPLYTGNPTDIQDVLFLENRDRRYDKTVYELRGVYNVADAEFDLRQFGLFLENDTIFMSFHLNDMVALLGRKIMPGDVLELPHQRDDFLLNEGRSINKFYIVDDANRAAEGYSPTWWPHIWRVKLKPMPGSQEYQDVLDAQTEDRYGMVQGRIGDLMSNLANELNIGNEILDEAKKNVPARNFETQHFYVVPAHVDDPATGLPRLGQNGRVEPPNGNGAHLLGDGLPLDPVTGKPGIVKPGDELGSQYPWIFAGDGIPPDGAIPIGAGRAFPKDAQEGDYYLRTDYEPKTLFRKTGGVWRIQELDYRRGDWSMAHRLLLSFINDQNVQKHDDGTVAPEKSALSKAIKPRADF